MISVAVTGGGGYLGTSIVKELLGRGYKVNAAVRNPENKEKVDHLKELPNSQYLTIFKGDNMIPRDYDECFQNCEYIIHVASPLKFLSPEQDPQKELIDPAVNGVCNALNSASKANIKRFIFTSSTISICGDQVKNDPKHIFSELDWNDSPDNDYAVSKVKAEKMAWQKSKELDIDLVVINPGLILGPVYSKRLDSLSVQTMKQLVSGDFKGGAPPIISGIADIRDVALAHILAFEIKEATGRYCITNIQQDDILTISNYIEEQFPDQFELPKTRVDDTKILRDIHFDHSKAEKELALKFHDIKDTVKDMIDSFKRYQII